MPNLAGACCRKTSCSTSGARFLGKFRGACSGAGNTVFGGGGSWEFAKGDFGIGHDSF